MASQKAVSLETWSGDTRPIDQTPNFTRVLENKRQQVFSFYQLCPSIGLSLANGNIMSQLAHTDGSQHYPHSSHHPCNARQPHFTLLHLTVSLCCQLSRPMQLWFDIAGNTTFFHGTQILKAFLIKLKVKTLIRFDLVSLTTKQQQLEYTLQRAAMRLKIRAQACSKPRGKIYLNGIRQVMC